MRRLLSFILFLCAAIGVYAQTDYGLTVAGTEVTSSNAGDILGDGKVSYDAASKTLHLKDAAIQSYGTGIAAKDKITIDLTGNSTIDATTCFTTEYNAADNSDFGTTITSSSGGTLNIIGRYGIMSGHGGLLITECTLNSECHLSALYGDMYGNNRTLKIVHSDLNLKGTSTESCISNYETFTLEGCQITEPSDAFFMYEWGYGAMYQGTTTNFCVSLKIKADVATSYGISGATVNGEMFTINSENYADVLGDGTLSYNPEQNTLTMNGTHLYGLIVLDLCKPDLRINIVGKETTIDEYFMPNVSCTLVGNNTKKAVTSQLNVNSIGLASSLTIQNLAVEFIGSKQGFQSQSGTASLTLRNATVNANGAEGVFKSIPSLVLEDCEILTPEGAYYDAEKKYIVDESGNRVTGVVTIGQKPVVEYGIRIDDETVTEENCADVLGNGTVSYDATKNALRLNNAKIKNIVFESNCKSGVRMDVEGTANELETISFNVAGSISGSNSGSDVKSAIKIKNTTSYAIDMQKGGDVTIENVNLDIDGAVCVGSGNNVLTLRNATVSVVNNTSGTQLFKDLANIVFEDCYRYSPTASYFDAELKTYFEEDLSGEQKDKPLTKHILIVPGKSLPGSGTSQDPYIVDESIGTFLMPVGETYYKYRAKESRVMSYYVTGEVGEDTYVSFYVNLTTTIRMDRTHWNGSNSIRSEQSLIEENGFQNLHVWNNDGMIGAKITINFREPAEGETEDKAILLTEGDKISIPTVDRYFDFPLHFKVTVPAKKHMIFQHAGKGDGNHLGYNNSTNSTLNYVFTSWNDTDAPSDLSMVTYYHQEYNDAYIHFVDEMYDIYFDDKNEKKRVYVTNENYSNTFGDGTVSYDPATDVLTLNNASLKDYELYSYIGYEKSRKIQVIGENTLRKIRAYGNNTFSGNGKVIINSDNEDAFEGNEYWSTSYVTIEDCDFEINAPASNGFYRAYLTIRNANVKITNDEEWNCLHTIKDLTLEGCRIVSPEGAYFDKDKETVVDKDGNPVKGELIIAKIATPEKGTGTKDDPFVLDGILPPPSPVPGTGEGDPGKPGTGPGGTGTGSYTNPPTIIAPPAGTSSCYTFTATDDCVLGLAVSVGNEFEGKLIINGYDAGNIDDREVLLRKGNVVMLDIANAGKDDLVAVNLREPGEGEIWYKAILLDEGTHTIPAIISSKNVALWYKVVVPDMRNISLTTSSIGDMAVFAEDDADSEVEGSMVTAGDEGLEYSHDNTTGSDEPLYFKVSDMASGCTATVVFKEELGIIEVTTDGTVTAPAYNVSGQRVGNGYKGVTIMNGRKFVRR